MKRGQHIISLITYWPLPPVLITHADTLAAAFIDALTVRGHCRQIDYIFAFTLRLLALMPFI